MKLPQLKAAGATNLEAHAIARWAWILACAFATIVSYWANGTNPQILTADVASEAVLADAVVRHGGIFATSEFIYSTEVQIVGHHLLLEIGTLLFPHDWHLARTFVLALLMAMLVASYRFMAKQAHVWEGGGWVAGVLLLPFGTLYNQFFLLGMFYLVSLCVTFASVGLWLEASRHESVWPTRALIALVLGFAFGVNGVRTTLLCYIPVLVGAIALLLLDSSGNTIGQRLLGGSASARNGVVFAGVLCAGGLVGTCCNVLIFSKWFEYTNYGSLALQTLSFSDFVDFMALGLVESWGYEGGARLSSGAGLSSLCGLLVSILIVIALVVCAIRRKELDKRQASLLIGLLTAYLLSSGMYYLGGQANHRYLTLVAIPLVVAVPIALGMFKHDRLLNGLIAVTVCACLLLQSYVHWYGPSLRHVQDGNPYAKERIAQWLVGQGYTQGVATFWNCNDLIELSSGRLDIWCVGASNWDENWWRLQSYRWLEERFHAEQDPEGAIFVVLTNDELNQLARRGVELGDAAYTLEEYSVYDYDSMDALRRAFGVDKDGEELT